jgi:hypothetical protein
VGGGVEVDCVFATMIESRIMGGGRVVELVAVVRWTGAVGVVLGRLAGLRSVESEMELYCATAIELPFGSSGCHAVSCFHDIRGHEESVSVGCHQHVDYQDEACGTFPSHKTSWQRNCQKSPHVPPAFWTSFFLRKVTAVARRFGE